MIKEMCFRTPGKGGVGGEGPGSAMCDGGGGVQVQKGGI